MTEPWTARRRDELLTRVSRTTVASTIVAVVAAGGISFGLASATGATAVASGTSGACVRPCWLVWRRHRWSVRWHGQRLGSAGWKQQ